MASDINPSIEETESAGTESPSTGPTVSSRAAQAAHQAIDQLSARGAEAELRLRDAGTRVSARSQELTKELTDYVTEKPLAALGIAAAAGFVLGVLLRR